ncbi:LETM1-like domain protein [Allomuricauda ruestringensis DSM 13258]|uniref:LETM1-like domain protein n=1 Tax=Allomuricauda ruestringensis (strain DSM 13258 / CIP 107369 / LMG 19739 / B1) TaxID=886377 RepID=G2PR47_ALLRU|nr:LETM1-related biofilm-associated protein [Allomuricauda ruestringensis]AEM69179.1 LETM1-like domain protein [Allomuricauda ruestringensis DSM 13258]
MNPSASGWINKFGHLVDQESSKFEDFNSLYRELKANGFIYGVHLNISSFIAVEHPLSEDEIAKINLLTALYFTYTFEVGKTDFEAFVNKVFEYYQSLNVSKVSFLNRILSGSKTESQLEKLIDSRIYLSDNTFSRALGNSLTNSLLYVDILIFMVYLRGNRDMMEHAQLLEYVTINIVYHALNSKETHESDEKLIQLLGSSLTYVDLDKTKFDGNFSDLLTQNFTENEKDYFLDMACLTIWEDKALDYTETDYIFGLGKDLGKSKKEVEFELGFVANFFEKNKDKIAYLNNKNLAVQFYDGMSKNVSKLILRNSKRLKKELAQSRELVALLSKSTVKDLNAEEKKKVQNQLLDIFKSIPSLAIFMLPGGAILLPIFIKLIPKLLPSAFDDNRVEEK